MKGIHRDHDLVILLLLLFESSFQAKTQSALGSFLNVAVRNVALLVDEEDDEDEADEEVDEADDEEEVDEEDEVDEEA